MTAEIASAEVLLIVLAVGLLVFGSSKVPKIARGLGSARAEFERGQRDGDHKGPADEAPSPRSTRTPAH